MEKHKSVRHKCPDSQQYSSQIYATISVNLVYTLPIADIIPNCSVDNYGWIVQQLVSGQTKR